MAPSASEQIDAIIARSADWRGETLSRLRGLVVTARPAMVEEVKWKKPSRPEGVPVWSHNGVVCIGEMLKDTVRLTFPNGARLKDPNRLFNARLASNTVRAIDFSEGEQVRETGLKALIVEAAGLNVESARAPGASKGKGHITVNFDKNLTPHVGPRRRSGSTALPPDRGNGRAGRCVPRQDR